MGGGRSARRNGEPVRADFAIGGRQEVAGVVARDDRIVGVDLVAVDVELVAGEAVMVAHHHGLGTVRARLQVDGDVGIDRR